MDRPPTGVLVNAGTKLPVGFRFHPTDEELLVHYLRRKAFNLPLPSLLVPECDDVFNRHPRTLPGDAEEKHRYFFSRKQRNGNGITGSRYWKAIGEEERVLDSVRNQTVGIRRTMVSGDAKKSFPKGTKTRWIMHEFCLPPTIGMHRMEGEGWAVYHVFRKKMKATGMIRLRKSNINRTEEMSMMPDCIDLSGQDSCEFGPPPPISP